MKNIPPTPFQLSSLLSFCSKWTICHQQKEIMQIILTKFWKCVELINFLIISYWHHEYDSFHFDAVWFWSIRFDSIEIGFIWFVSFNHLFELESINLIRHFRTVCTRLHQNTVWSTETVKKIRKHLRSERIEFAFKKRWQKQRNLCGSVMQWPH